MKVSVNKEIFKALNNVKMWETTSKCSINAVILSSRLNKNFIGENEVLNDFDFDLFMQSLVNGYELEENVKEKVLSYIRKEKEELENPVDAEHWNLVLNKLSGFLDAVKILGDRELFELSTKEIVG